MKKHILLLSGLMVAGSLTFTMYSKTKDPEYPSQDQAIRFTGLRIFVNDLKEAEGFYTKTLNLEVTDRNKQRITLNSNTWPIILEVAEGKTVGNYPNAARTGLSFQTYKLLPRIDDLRDQGVMLHDSLLNRNGVGISIPFEDPSGNVISAIEVQIREIESFEGLRIYNTGVTIADMDAAIHFYEKILGYEEWSRNYLPDALPLKHSDGSFAFMIHYKKGLQKNLAVYGKHSQIVLMMETQDLDQIKLRLKNERISFTSKSDRIVCRDPEGNFIEITGNSTP